MVVLIDPITLGIIALAVDAAIDALTDVATEGAAEAVVEGGAEVAAEVATEAVAEGGDAATEVGGATLLTEDVTFSGGDDLIGGTTDIGGTIDVNGSDPVLQSLPEVPAPSEVAPSLYPDLSGTLPQIPDTYQGFSEAMAHTPSSVVDGSGILFEMTENLSDILSDVADVVDDLQEGSQMRKAALMTENLVKLEGSLLKALQSSGVEPKIARAVAALVAVVTTSEVIKRSNDGSNKAVDETDEKIATIISDRTIENVLKKVPESEDQKQVIEMVQSIVPSTDYANEFSSEGMGSKHSIQYPSEIPKRGHHGVYYRRGVLAARAKEPRTSPYASETNRDLWERGYDSVMVS